MPDSATSLWEAAQTVLRNMLKPEIFSLWFAPLKARSLEADTLILEVADDFTMMWLNDNYSELLRSVVSRAAVRLVKVQMIVAPAPGPAATVQAVAAAPAEAAAAANPRSEASVADRRDSGKPGDAPLISTLRFSNFVVGNNNEFACSVARAVAANPGRTFNPLFLFGGVGLGKTHLLHAIGHEIIEHRRGAKIAYLSCERFTNEFISALQENDVVKFRRRYRHVEALLVDDIQFLAGKERVQEEFFHTFNTLHDARRLIVLTCDRPASEIPGLEQRLISRFEWGQTADIRPPDVETRLAILRNKQASLGSAIPDQILNFLAERIRTNIRRLEGAILRVSAYSQLADLTIPVVESLLREILEEEAQDAVTIEAIQRRVAEHFDIRFSDMTGRRRPEFIALPRQIAMYLARNLTGASFSQIGEAFGGRDHGTVLHACRAVKDRMEVDATIRQAVGFLEKQLLR